MIKQGLYLDAIDPLRRAASLVPYHRAYRYNLFIALSRAGQQAEAQAELDRFKSLETSSVRVVDGADNPREYLKQGKYAEAMPGPGGKSPPPRPEPRFQDEAARAGIDFRHHGPANDSGARRIIEGEPAPRSWFADGKNRTRLISLTGAGAAFCDYDNDGRLDIFLVDVNGGHTLFNQLADGRFENSTSRAGLSTAGPKLGTACVWGDFDNDDGRIC